MYIKIKFKNNSIYKEYSKKGDIFLQRTYLNCLNHLCFFSFYCQVFCNTQPQFSQIYCEKTLRMESNFFIAQFFSEIVPNIVGEDFSYWVSFSVKLAKGLTVIFGPVGVLAGPSKKQVSIDPLPLTCIDPLAFVG